MSEIIGSDRDQPDPDSADGKPPKQDEPRSIKLVVILALAGLISGIGIVGIYEVTLETITRNKAEELRAAVFKVLPGVTQMQELAQENDQLVAVASEEGAESRDDTIYGGYDQDRNFVGYAIPGQGPGFQDTIKLLYGYLPDSNKVVGMEVLESRETPGLGDKIYKDLVFVGAFADLPIEPTIEVVKKGRKVSDNQVDAITGATISSRAVVKIINDTNSIWLENLPAVGSEPVMQVNTDENNSEGENVNTR
jgi:electron transport complex protein RnfG